MATLNITLPEGASICNGKQVTFRAPCDCTGVTGLIIEGVTYALLTTAGEAVGNGKSFIKDALVSVIVDTEQKNAYLQSSPGGADVVEMTYAEYQDLETKNPDTLYIVTDKTVGGVGDAEFVNYNNATSGLTATNVQAAIDELGAKAAEPTEHASSHAADGSDPITPEMIGAQAKLTGTEGQMVGFDADGNAVAMNVSLPTKKVVLKTEIITEDTTWYAPTDMDGTSVNVRLFGGGGGGGGGAQHYEGGAGGGGGGGMAAGTVEINPGDAVIITIGAGGTGGTAATSEYSRGTDGGAGGSSSFGGYLSAEGGSGGAGSQNSGYGGAGGAGGSGGGGGHAYSWNYVGGAGGKASYGGGGGGGRYGGAGGAGGTYGGGGGSGIGSMDVAAAGGGVGGTYGGKGGQGSTDGGNPSAATAGTNTVGMGLDFEGTGAAGATASSDCGGAGGGGYGGVGGTTTSYGGGGGGGYGAAGGKGNKGAAGGGGYGGPGGDGGTYAGGGGGGGYSAVSAGGSGPTAAGGNGLDGAGYASGGGGSAGGGSTGGNGAPGICIISYYVATITIE